MKKEILFIISIVLVFSSCKNRESVSKLATPVMDSLAIAEILEAREDSIEFANTLMLQEKIENSIKIGRASCRERV